MVNDTNEQTRRQLSAELFKALGNPDRIALLEELNKGPRCVCELASALGLSKSVASKHLSLLYSVGIVDAVKQGTQVSYSLLVPCVVEMGACSYLATLNVRKSRLPG